MISLINVRENSEVVIIYPDYMDDGIHELNYSSPRI